jgi:hypothetical protein
MRWCYCEHNLDQVLPGFSPRAGKELADQMLFLFVLDTSEELWLPAW